MIQMPVGEIPTGLGRGAKIREGLHGGDAREFLAEVVRVAAAVVRGMQQAVNVVEEIFFGERGPFVRSGMHGLEMGEFSGGVANAAPPKRGANNKPHDAFKFSNHLGR